MRAVVLAAGEGSRLRPLTETKPKGMVGVGNRPILDHVLEALVANDLTDVTVVVGYHRERIQAHLGDGDRLGCRVTYAFQSPLLGTAHALAQVEDGDEALLVLGGDTLVDAALVGALLDAPDLSLVAYPSPNPSKYGVLDLQGDRVARIEEKPPAYESELVNTGVYRFPPDFLPVLRRDVKEGYMGLAHVLQHEIEAGATVHAVRTDALWLDTLYPWDVLHANARLLAGGSSLRPAPTGDAAVHADATVEGLVGEATTVAARAVVQDSTLGDNVRVAPGAVLENCVVYDDAQVGAGAILRNSIVGEGARVGEGSLLASGPCDVRAPDGYHPLEDFGVVVGEDALVGPGARLLPGVLVGARAVVDPAATVRTNVPRDGRVL